MGRDWKNSKRGMVWAGWRVGYSFDRGFGRGWLPRRVQRLIVASWNWFGCKFGGHEWFPPRDGKREFCQWCGAKRAEACG